MANHNEILMDIDLQIIDELQMEVILEKYKGEKGDPGEGFPEGGTTGQVLAKRSDADYDTEWVDSGTDIIDDSAGAGDTDKTWSADKITQELDSLDPTLTESIESTAVAVFDDGADDLPLEELRVEINPVQDLHGYEKPWVGGAGANLIPDGTDTTNGFVDNKYLGSSGSTYSSEAYYVSEFFPVTAGQVYTMSNSGNAMNSQAVCFYNESKAYISGQNFGNQTVRQVTAPESAVYARCTQSKDFSSRLIQFEKGDTATTPTPYKNICPISGYTGVEVRDEGKNLFTTEGQTTPAYINNQGTIYTNSNDWTLSDYIPVIAKTQYTFKPNSTSGSAAKHGFYNANKEFMTYIDSGEQTFTTPENCAYMRFSYRVASTNIQLERGSVATEYVPFTGNNVYPIQFPSEAGTVYSGYLTVHKDGTGEVVADRSIHEYDGTEGILLNATAGKFKQVNSYDWMRSSFGGELMSNMLTVGNSGDYVVAISDNIYFTFPMCETVTDMKAKLAELYANGTPMVLSAKLNTPISYPLTTTQVRTLLGYNAISADSGNVALTYRKDSEVNYELARLEEKIDSRPEIINDETVADDSVWSSEKVDGLTTTEQETVSGDIVTFETDAEQLLEQLTVSIAPVQDLHGYDSPWVGGAGKNLFNEETVTLHKWISSSGAVSDNNYGCISAYIPVTGGSNYGITFKGVQPYSMSICEYNSSDTFIKRTHYTTGNKGNVTLDANTAKVIVQVFSTSDTTVMTADILASEKVMFYAGSTEPEEYSPYENLCPITGWDGVEVQRKNLPIVFDSIGAVADTDYVNGKAYDVNTGAINTTQGHMIFTAYVKCIPGETYYLSGNKSATQSRGVYVSYYDVNQNFLSSANPIENTSSTGIIRGSFTVPAGVAYMRFTTPTLVADSFFVSDGVEIPADYVYAGQTYSISFPSSAGTVYGGTLTINRDGSGSLVVDRKGVDGGNLTWVKVTGNNYRNFTAKTEPEARYVADTPTVISSNYASTSNNASSATADSYCWIRATSSTVRDLCVKDTAKGSMTVEEFTTAMTGVQFVYELATPVTYSLTANQVRTLLGYNAIWANSGDVSVTYRKGSLADLTSMTNVESRTLSTLSMLAPIEFSPATSAHAVNDVFIVGDKLYRATASIAQGAEIAEGTNVEQTTIMTVLQNAWGVSF